MSTLELVVDEVRPLAEGIRELVLAAPDGAVLPAHPPGSHLVVDCGDGRRNAYSLTSPGDRPRRYRIGVLHRPDGAGGSRRLHRLAPGAALHVSTPRSAFAPVRSAARHLLVAGGIGVTPILSHAREAIRWNRPVQALYVHRPGAGAYREELTELLGDRLATTTDPTRFGDLLDAALHGQPLGTHLYVCGPGPLTDRVLGAAAAAGWPADRLHLERFVPERLDPGRGFVARLARTGRDVPVPPGTSLLEALGGSGVEVPSMCRQGFCGECRVPVLAGRPLHRDEYLDDDERDRGDSVLCCVSRSETDTLEIDL